MQRKTDAGNSKRVLHLLSQRPSWTGSGTALEAMVRAAERAGWEQRVVVGIPVDDADVAVGGLPSEQIFPLIFGGDALPFSLPGMSDVMPYSSSRFSELSTEQLAEYRDAWRMHLRFVLERFQPDVIHSHHLWLLSSLVKDVLAELELDIPVVSHCHGTGLRQQLLCPHLADEVRTGCRRNDHFIALHQGNSDDIQTQMSVSADRIDVIGSGFRDEIFHTAGRVDDCGMTIAYAGKLSDAKGLPWLLDAVERLAKRVPNLVLHVAGSGAGAEADAIRQRMEELAGTVQFHSQLNQEQLAERLRAVAVFVLPSFYEGVPLVLVEAAACGCQIVATELPGVVEQLAPVLGDQLELVTLPRLQNTDRPVADDLPAFVDRLESALLCALEKPCCLDVEQRLSDMTWNGVFQRIEAIWNELIAASSTG